MATDIFQRSGVRSLSEPWCRNGSWNIKSKYGLIAWSQSHPLDCPSGNQGWINSGHRGNTQTIYENDQFQGRLARSFMTGGCVICHGREMVIGVYPLYWVQSGPCRSCKMSWGLEMEQCRGTHMDKKDEILVKTSPPAWDCQYLLERFLFSDIHKSEIELFRKHERTDWPFKRLL